MRFFQLNRKFFIFVLAHRYTRRLGKYANKFAICAWLLAIFVLAHRYTRRLREYSGKVYGWRLIQAITHAA